MAREPASCRSRFAFAATECVSVPLEPDITGGATIAGTSLHANRCPKQDHDSGAARVTVIGTGSSGAPSIPL